MQRHRLRQGLASSAVAALAMTGLAVAAAPASAAGDGVVLLSQAGAVVSVRAEGSEGFPPMAGVADLTAERPTTDTTVTFEVNPDPAADDGDDGWVTIGEGQSSVGRLVRAQWDGTAGGQSLVGTSVALRAVGTSGDQTTYSTRHDVAVAGQASEVDAVSVRFASNAYFPQPYADSGRTASLLRVSGTTSAVDGTVELSWWRSSDGTFAGQTDAALSPSSYKVSGESTFRTGGMFNAALDITGYDAEANDGAIAVRAARDSDATAIVETYAQVPTTVPVYQGGASSTGATITVAPLDQNSSIMTGAEVRRVSDGSLVGYTDVNGTVTAHQDAGSTESYYVNTTDTDELDGADPVSSPVEVPAYVPVATSVRLVTEDGRAFDDDEYAEGDVALQVVDQEGNPLGGLDQEITYSLTPPGGETPAPGTGLTDGSGRLALPFDPAGSDGAYTVAFSRPGSTTIVDEDDFVAGQAELGLSPEDADGEPGGQITFTGDLTVAGQPLAGREVDLGYTRGTELPPGTSADAGIVRDEDLVLDDTVSTDGDGRFEVTVADPAEDGSPYELGGQLAAHAVSALADGTAKADFGMLSTELDLADGPVFDMDEYAAGDVALQVVDAEGAPVAAAGQQVQYAVTAPGEETPEPTTGTTDAEGRIVLPFDPSGPDGEYVVTFTEPASSGGSEVPGKEFVAGQAELELTPEAGTADPGGSIAYTGSLMIGGLPLVGRDVDLSYTRGLEAAASGADAGLVDGEEIVLDRTVTTDEEGAFSVTVADPAEAGDPSETGGHLHAEAGAADTEASATADFGTPTLSTELVLADGDVFDPDEYAAGDVALQVVDAAGEPVAVAGASIGYVLDGTGDDPVLTTATTNAAGRVVLPVAATGGDHTVRFTTPTAAGDGDLLPEETFTVGDAALSLTPTTGKAAAGGQITYAGRLAVGDQPLAGRTITLAFTRGAELVPGTGADAGILVGGARRLTATVTTAADGTFSVTVDDPVEAGNPAETAGKLTATSASTKTSAGATAAFGSGPGTVKLRLSGSSKGAAADKLVVAGTPSVAGERVTVFAKAGTKWKAVKTAVLDRTGGLRLSVKDTNGTKKTSYYVRLLPSARTATSTSATKKLP